MNNLELYCMCLYDDHLENVKALGYIPVGLGKNKFRAEWLRDNQGKNISHKNLYYGEYSFYYWFWKNKLNEIPENKWIGFSHYRHHWSNQNQIKSDELNLIINEKNYESYILKGVNPEWNSYDVILGDPMDVNGRYKLTKILKNGFSSLGILSKNLFAFTKKNRNIKLQFDFFHGYGIMDKAISVLDEKEKNDFKNYIDSKHSYNRENMFICRSKKLMNEYFLSVFSWLERCEPIFGFNLKGYAKTRIYTFLAERYISYWFNKYSKPLYWPIFFFDTNKNKLRLKK
jgi:hypothetical protein